ncbi:acyltransferase family protein [Pelagicoccus albus]|uniref:Acyltransferase family protein n=1 Tax=Pelagicoccus albus TaxID=415222 RepID=A0A7X1B6L8_9BACT|nr:acyltransferase family protein [Pelagicoccus albus]MBC2606611.1 acyltransferase family protein [Pelagicoccus albus]
MKPNHAKRTHWLDLLKAVGMLLVVYGHSGSTSPEVDQWIYSFHMPLFFLVSGYLFKDSALLMTTGSFIAKQLKNILIPYILFSAVGYMAWLVLTRILGAPEQSIPIYYPVLAFLYGTGTPEVFRLVPVVLWFFPCLLCAQIIAYLLLKHGKNLALAFSLVLGAGSLLLPQSLVLPFELETALGAQFIILLGVIARRKNCVEYLAGKNWYFWIPALFAAGTWAAMLNVRVDMRSNEFGNVALFLASSIGITLALSAAFFRARKVRLVELISKNTVVIFPLHTIAFSAVHGIGVLLAGAGIATLATPWLGLLESVAITIALGCLGRIFRTNPAGNFGLPKPLQLSF